MSTTTKAHDVAAEFVTVDAVLASGATTRRTDALVLTWVKVEKQLRRLFSYLVYQNPAFSKTDESALVEVFVANRRLNWESFIKCIDSHGRISVRQLIGAEYEESLKNLKRIRDYRNKILHGQITGQRLKSQQLERDIGFLRTWIEKLAAAADEQLGYDGIGRNTFNKARLGRGPANMSYPFATIEGFQSWLTSTVNGSPKR
jgi:hypothetical protein